MSICEMCKECGMRFERQYKPEDYIEGDPKSPIWIIGINPSNDTNWLDNRSAEELKKYFLKKDDIHSYFKDFAKVSYPLFERLGTLGGVAHTDVVKCSSRSFPPAGVKGKKAEHIVNNCSQFMVRQIKQHKPRLLICNGAKVSEYILDLLPPNLKTQNKQTNYWSELDGAPIRIVLSGFIGRIDDYSKRRLGLEIEEILTEMKMF